MIEANAEVQRAVGRLLQRSSAAGAGEVRDVDDRSKSVESLKEKFVESRAAFVSPELLIRSKLAGYRLVEVPVPHYPRIAGRPKGAPPKVIFRTISELVRLRRSLRTAPVALHGTSSADTP